MTVFMSTHSLHVAEEISDRIGIVDRGELKFLGTLTELRAQSAVQHTSLEDLYLQITSRAEVPVAAAASPTAAAAVAPSEITPSQTDAS